MQIPELCLGTVQFGLDYGISNQAGIVPRDEVKRILQVALNSNIKFLDTAQAYGNAELCLGGESLSKNFKINSKLNPALSSVSVDNIEDLLEKSFMDSLRSLGRKEINSFMVHNPGVLKTDKGALLIDWLDSKNQRSCQIHRHIYL